MVLSEPIMASDNSGVYNVTIDVGEESTRNVMEEIEFPVTSSPHRLHYIVTDSSRNTDTCDTYVTVEGQYCPPKRFADKIHIFVVLKTSLFFAFHSIFYSSVSLYCNTRHSDTH